MDDGRAGLLHDGCTAPLGEQGALASPVFVSTDGTVFIGTCGASVHRFTQETRDGERFLVEAGGEARYRYVPEEGWGACERGLVRDCDAGVVAGQPRWTREIGRAEWLAAALVAHPTLTTAEIEAVAEQLDELVARTWDEIGFRLGGRSLRVGVPRADLVARLARVEPTVSGLTRVVCTRPDEEDAALRAIRDTALLGTEMRAVERERRDQTPAEALSRLPAELCSAGDIAPTVQPPGGEGN